MSAVALFAISLNQTPLDWAKNRQTIIAGLSEARRQGGELVCLPEMSLCGYGCEDAFLWPDTAARSLLSLEQLLPETSGLIVTFGLPLAVDGRLYNACAVAVDGRLVGIACKRHLANDGIHYEQRWFSSWPKGTATVQEILGNQVPVGDLIFELGGLRVAFEICEDAWVKDRPAQELGARGIDVILNPSASHFSFEKHAYRRKLVLEGARHVKTAYVYCNLLGNEAGRAIYDGDCLIARGGRSPEIIAESRRFSFLDFQLAGATVSRSRERVQGDSVQDEASLPSRRIVSAPFSFGSDPSPSIVTSHTPGQDPQGILPKEQSFGRAVALGLCDYLRKSRSRGFVVSLSGGADSAAVSLLVRLMVRLCVSESGVERAWTRLLPDQAPGNATEEELVSALLTTVYQATRHSSETTRRAAEGVARALHARHHEVTVDEFVDGYGGKVEQILGRQLSWAADDVALQNIQARVRAPLVWMLANTNSSLLLSTSNRSEAAVGYATMDGDTAGGLCPIAGIDKSFLRRWLIFMEKVGLAELGPIPELSLINAQQPTAELRPAEYEQTDEGDLMPYDVLDFIERQTVYRRKAPPEVLQAVAAEFQCEKRQALEWMKRFYRLFSINQWKRERFAPSFFLDEGNLDPKTWFRFPILSGGFEEAVAELELMLGEEAKE